MPNCELTNTIFYSLSISTVHRFSPSIIRLHSVLFLYLCLSHSSLLLCFVLFFFSLIRINKAIFSTARLQTAALGASSFVRCYEDYQINYSRSWEFLLAGFSPRNRVRSLVRWFQLSHILRACMRIQVFVNIGIIGD